MDDLNDVGDTPDPAEAAEERTIYYRAANGALSTASGYPWPSVPPGATELTEAEYLAALAELEAEAAAQAEAERLAAEQKKLDDFTGLMALGIPEALARSLSGYTGPWPLAAG